MFMMIFMTAMMVLMSFRSGTLALYWVVGNLYTIVQTLINRKTNEIKWERAQSNNTITGVKIKVEKPNKKDKKEKIEEKDVKEEKPEKKLKPMMEPKSKRKALGEEENIEVFTENNNDAINNSNSDIVDAEFEEIDDKENNE